MFYKYESKAETRVSVVIDIYIDKKRCLTIETSRDCWGWHISLLPRTGTKDLVTSIISIDRFSEQRHPAQDESDTFNKQFYGSHHI